MASGTKMSYNNHYQNSKYGTLPHPPQNDVEVTQDMHLKMSKKIAQLTKVIYALNTKNDENESVIQALRDQHEEEIQKIISETRQKLTAYKDRLDEGADQQQSIESLHSRISQQQSQHATLEERFAQYKAEVQEKQQKEKDDYALKINEMTHDLLQAKQGFQEQMNRYTTWKERIESEHNTALADINSKHQSEVENLRDFHRNQDDSWLNQCSAIEEKYKSQIDNLTSQVDTLQSEKSELKDEFTVKLEKAQAFYEKELEALKNQQFQEHDSEISSLRKEIEKLRLDYTSNDKEMRQQIDRLVRQLADAEDSLEQSQQQQKMLQAELSGKDSSSSELIKQVHDLREELGSKAYTLKGVELELVASKQHCADLNDELQKKSVVVGELEAHKMQKDSLLSAMQSELDILKAKLAQIEKQRTSELAQQSSLSSEQMSQLTQLRMALEDMTVEKETLKQRLEKQIQSLQDSMVKREKELLEEMANKLKEMEQSHQEDRDRDRKTAAEVLLQTKEELLQTHMVQMEVAKSDKEAVQEELNKLRDEMTTKLSRAEDEIKQLQDRLKDKEDGLGSVSSQISSLNDVISQLRNELDKSKSDLKSSKTTAASLQAELDKLKVLHAGKMAELETALKERLEKLTKELDAKWTETMKHESSKLRQEISSQKEEEKKAALSQLSRLKDEEIKATRAGLDTKVEHLNAKIEELQSKLDNSKESLQSEKASWELQLEREKSQLNHNMLEAASDYATKIAAMEKMHADEIDRLTGQKEQEKQTLENELRQKHIEEIQGQMAAHRAAMDHTRQLDRRQKEEDMKALVDQHKEELDKLRQLLETERQQALDSLKQSHSMEIQAARMELERAVQISKQKDKDHQMQLEELRTEIGHREQHIKNLQDQLSKLQTEINRLKKELDGKASEIRQVQKQASQQLKVQEDRLNKKNIQALDNLAADHLREQQEILAQFNSAQEMLKDKISAVQIELEEAEMRYDQRDSRPEDLEMIEALRAEVSEREGRIKDLIDEKRFYQLELVNRETNFNKVFNTQPNVGVLDPFQKPKRKGDRGKLPSLTHGNGMSSSTQKLDPLPGSPMHDVKLNSSRPLPQPSFAKKFVR